MPLYIYSPTAFYHSVSHIPAIIKTSRKHHRWKKGTLGWSVATGGWSYLDSRQSRPWGSSLRGSELHQKACRQCSERLQLIPRWSCNNQRRLILAASPLPCSLISCDRADIHRNIKTAVYRARKIKCFQFSRKSFPDMMDGLHNWLAAGLPNHGLG